MHPRLVRALTGALVLSLTAGGFAAGRLWRLEPRPARAAETATSDAPAAETPSAAAAPVVRGLPSFAALVERVGPAVVHVKTVGIVRTGAQGGLPFGLPPGMFGDDGSDDDDMPQGFTMPHGFRFGPPQDGRPSFKRQGTGSGFVIRKDGLIVTNNHVVEDAKEISVTMHDGRELPAKVLGRDPKTDLAVIKVEPQGDLATVPLGDSDQVAVGDWVIAIGNPFGLDDTVTAGIVSAKGRAIGSGPYDDFIQTDASINPGNSGGPLFDEQGRVVGINTAIWSQSGGNIGIGFAIPINVAKTLVPQLENDGHVTRGWLGVTIQPLTAALAESVGSEPGKGMLVAAVSPNSPAAKAGLKTGDVILEWNGTTLAGSNPLPLLVANTPVGTTVPVVVGRDGKRHTLDVKVERLAEDTPVVASAGKNGGKWGLALRDLSPEEREQRKLGDDEGVLVTGVSPDSPAAEAGIRAGDVILRVNRQSVGSASAVKEATQKTPDDKPLLLLVRGRDGADHFAALTVG